MGDYAQRSPGDPPNTSADAFNAWQAAAKATTARPMQQAVRGSQGNGLSSSLVLCKNDDGGTLPTLGAVELVAPVIDPTAGDNALAQFKRGVVMKVKTPGSNPNFTWGVLSGQLADQAYGTVIVAGVTPCKINLLNTTDTFVDAVSGDTIPQSGDTGAAQIVWVDGWTESSSAATSTGEQWAVIRLGIEQPEDIGNVKGQSHIMPSDNQAAWGFPFFV